MRYILPLALLVTGVAHAGGATDLTVDGVCPGPIEFSITGTPGATFVLVAGDEDGTKVIPHGPCAGADLGVTSPEGVLFRRALRDVEVDGSIDVTVEVPGGACGKLFTVIDMDTCAVSPVRLESFFLSLPSISGRWPKRGVFNSSDRAARMLSSILPVCATIAHCSRRTSNGSSAPANAWDCRYALRIGS